MLNEGPSLMRHGQRTRQENDGSLSPTPDANRNKPHLTGQPLSPRYENVTQGGREPGKRFVFGDADWVLPWVWVVGKHLE